MENTYRVTYQYKGQQEIEKVLAKSQMESYSTALSKLHARGIVNYYFINSEEVKN